MDKISVAGTLATQQVLLARMQQTAAAASFDAGQAIAPANGAFALPSPIFFSQVLNGTIDNVDALQHSAGARQKAIDMGQSDDLADAMIESQKASVAFSAMMQVRNKLTSALDEVMNIPL
ncbi:flagellar hook-basal body complex protein FliE [Citrobacter portucalensis]|uniref:flagellar hook-basal body complex protein FliE n=1 Tax=Citrobacter portucalensis TaxID=1639133 RepID=UPI003CF3C417